MGKNAVLEEVKDGELDGSNQYGYLSWLTKIIDLGDDYNSDIWLEKAIKEEDIREGLIVDA